MQFWPLALIVLGSGLAALIGMAVMMKLQKANTRGISPHHRRNTRTDLMQAREADAAVDRRNGG